MKWINTLLLSILFFSCSQNPTGNSKNGEINGYLTVGKYKIIPQHEIQIHLYRILDFDTFELDTLGFTIPDKNGYYEFTELKIDHYHLRIYPKQYYA